MTHAPSPRCNLPASYSTAVTEGSRGNGVQENGAGNPPRSESFRHEIAGRGGGRGGGGVCVQANEPSVRAYFTPPLAQLRRRRRFILVTFHERRAGARLAPTLRRRTCRKCAARHVTPPSFQHGDVQHVYSFTVCPFFL